MLEEKRVSRIGISEQKHVEFLFVCASNEPPPSYSIAGDLLSRLRVLTIPSLKERTADVPDIFEGIIKGQMSRLGLDGGAVISCLGGDHYEALCIDGMPSGNIRELADLADRITSIISLGEDPERAVNTVFGERFPDNPVILRHSHHQGRSRRREDPGDADQGTDAMTLHTAHELGDDDQINEEKSSYKKYRELIIDTYHRCNGNISATERGLRDQGLRFSCRWLSIYLKEWGVKK